MLESIVRGALNQRLIIVVIAAAAMFFGLRAAQKLSVDAFPDVTTVQVQIATSAPGRSPEEVERFVTVPLEIAMTGLPGLVEMRSLNKPALSILVEPDYITFSRGCYVSSKGSLWTFLLL